MSSTRAYADKVADHSDRSCVSFSLIGTAVAAALTIFVLGSSIISLSVPSQSPASLATPLGP